MKEVYIHINEEKEKLSHENFFLNFSQIDNDILLPICGLGLSFWIMTFQDALRLNASKFNDPSLGKIAEQHRQEDSGHELWYLHDLAALGIQTPDLYTLYSPCLSFVRDSSYEIMSQIISTDDDYTRLALIEAIEAASEVFFCHIVKNTSSGDKHLNLLFFSNHHYQAELSHNEENLMAVFHSHHLTERERERVIAAVDRTFKAFHTIFDGLNNMIATYDPRLFNRRDFRGSVLTH
ncbi:hypothetical protein [Hahella ganghwensis]|uniref:hypothetical protein n=1 Tax=Hahella ganghwensis TaxID=286420 RepID=UPI0003753BEF|nr:hypothetical protein [Hahella ganghwensis]